MTDMEFVELFRRKIKEKENWTKSLFEAFHRMPELSMEEYRTTEKIAEELEKMGIASKRLDPTGLTAWIGPGTARSFQKEEGMRDPVYTIGLRADIDGLPEAEETGLPYCSQNEGVMHACGHDGHIVGLLTAAAVLKEMEEELSVRVRLIFQPSEENARGAAHIIEQGVLDGVDEIFGLHLFSDIPSGKVSVEKGPRMAQTDRFTIIFTGTGGHAAKPHLCRDATVMAAEFVMSLQTILSREINPVEGAVVTVGSLHSGNQYNVISDKAVLEGTCRTYRQETARHLQDSIGRRAEAAAGIYGGEARVDYELGCHPPVINDGPMAGRIYEAAALLLGERKLGHEDPLMLGEDFSWYQTRIPGVFAFVGCGSPGQVCHPNHHPKFQVDEAALSDAALLHLAAVLSAEKKMRTESMEPSFDGQQG